MTMLAMFGVFVAEPVKTTADGLMVGANVAVLSKLAVGVIVM